VLAQTRCAITRERSSSGRRVPFDDRVAAMVLSRHEHRSHRLGFRLMSSGQRSTSGFSTPGGLRIYLSSTGSKRQPDAPGWAMRRCLPGPEADGFETSFWPSLLISWGDLSGRCVGTRIVRLMARGVRRPGPAGRRVSLGKIPKDCAHGRPQNPPWRICRCRARR
jgi:hypothetical protein